MDVTDNQANNGAAETEAAETQQSAGQSLRAARLVRGMSIEDVARQLRLSVRQITALEEDDYSKLSGGTFLRGFVRNYAKLVQVDAAPLLQVLQQSVPSASRQTIAYQTEGIPFPSEQKRGGRSLIIAGGVVLALSFLIYEIYRGNEVVQRPAAEVATEADAGIAQAGEQLQSQSASMISSDGDDPLQLAQEVAVTQAGNNNPLPAQQVAPAVVAPDPANKGESVLRFVFAEESWVEIRDSGGRMIFSQLNPGSSEQVVRGKAPLSLVIGNATNVKLVYNNKPVDLAPYTNTNGGVARLSLE